MKYSAGRSPRSGAAPPYALERSEGPPPSASHDLARRALRATLRRSRRRLAKATADERGWHGSEPATGRPAGCRCAHRRRTRASASANSREVASRIHPRPTALPREARLFD